MTIDALAPALFIGAVIVLVSVLGVRISGRWGVPSLLLYLILGLVLGQFVPDFRVSDPQLAVVLGYSALVLILVQGGLTTRASVLKPVLWPAIALASVGVITSIAVVAVPLIVFFDMDPRTALLLGCVLAATDSAAVFSILRRLHVLPRVRTLLEAEAGFNDAPVVVIVSVLAMGQLGADPWWQIALKIVYELVFGAAFGLAIGYASRWILRRLALPGVGLYPIAALALLVLAYGGATTLNASGFMAVYVAAVILGNARDVPHRRSIIGFADALAWVAEIGLFVMLGLLAQLDRLPEAVGIAAIALLLLVFLGRPAAAAISLLPFRIPMREVAFVGATGLRGAVPIVFAAIPLAFLVPDAALIFDATLIVVFVLLLIQGPTVPWLAKKLGVVKSDEFVELDIETAPLDGMRAEVLGFDVPPDSRLIGLYAQELGLPTDAVLSLIVRDGRGIAVDSNARIRARDRLLVVATAESRDTAEERLQQVGRHGRLATWRYDDP